VIARGSSAQADIIATLGNGCVDRSQDVLMCTKRSDDAR